MSLEDLRTLTSQMRLLEIKMGEMKDELKASPLKVDNYHPGRATRREVELWEQEKTRFKARQKPVLDLYNSVREKRDALVMELDQKPLSKMALADILGNLVEIEAAFSDATWEQAWTKTTKLIDWLEKDEQRLDDMDDEAA